MNEHVDSFRQNCIVELFGHTRIAGTLTVQEIGGESFLRIDIPEVDGNKGFTRFFGKGAIYSFTPVDEETMLQAVRSWRPKPVELWMLSALIPSISGVVDSQGDGLDFGEEEPQ